MKKLFILLLVTGIVVLLPFHGVQTTEQKNVSRFAADHFIVKMKKSADVLAASNPGMSLYEQRIKNLLGSMNVEVKSIFSHLSSSDDFEEQVYTEKQIKIFTKLTNNAYFGYHIIRYIVKSCINELKLYCNYTRFFQILWNIKNWI